MKTITTTLVAVTTCTGLVAVGVGALDACSSSSASGSDAGAAGSGSSVASAGDAAASCAAYATADCQYISACEPGTLSGTYGTLTQCETVQTTDCMNNVGAPGSGWTTSWNTACSAELQGYAAACDAGPIPRPIPAAGPCTLSGAGDAGAACGVAGQCGTGVCDRIGAVCGVCTTPGALGQPCGPGTEVTCAPGLACSSKNTCVSVVGVDASCDRGATTDCVGGAQCVIASADSGTSGTCVAEGVKAGTACNSTGVGAPDCWDVAGFFCNGSSQCQAISYAASGAGCGEADGGTSDTACAGGTCVGTSCATPAPAGQACTVGYGAGCEAGSVCAVIGSGAGCSSVNAACFGGEAGPPPFTFAPSNVSLTTILDQQGMAADENLSSACSVDTDANSPGDDCFTSPIEAVTQEDGSTVNLVVVHSLTVQSNGSIVVTGGVPLVIASLTTITVLGGNLQVDSSSTSLMTGAGGAPGATTNAAGGGPGGGAAGSASALVGGSGGSYCGLGGLGGGGTSTGKEYGVQGIRPLVGGSAGGGGAEGSGAGGGALQLVAGQSISLGAGSYINAGGQGGPIGGAPSADENSGGGGSGGSILLEAPVVTVAGTLAANGGGGGGDYSGNGGQDGAASAIAAQGGAAGSSDGAGGNGSAGTTLAGSAGTAPAGLGGGGGGGGAGRIRINSNSSAATTVGSTVSPALTTRCATQGFLRALTDGP
ncbi:MAG TPA: hypothetical protein VEK07_16500 [Polyangiaceae bacterium]|nr:hypothetical protein [Polyangiaceae bacterium]